MSGSVAADGRESSRRWLALLLVLSALYLGSYLFRGWYPHDEGLLGQTAERVLGGEVPHRDFDEPYTGLLTYLHAAAFAIGGIRLTVLRIPLFIASLCWLVAVFQIARRSVSPRTAAGVGLVALAWSVPNYPASMPSWYNLFCATFGVAALLAWEDRGRTKYLVLAGLAGGISFLFKLSGLFFVAGGLLYLLAAAPRAAGNVAVGRRNSPVVSLTVSAGLLALILILWRAIAPWYWPRVIYHFVAPGAVIAVALVIREWTVPLGPSAAVIRSRVSTMLPFLAGAAAPVALLAAFYAWQGAISELLHGVFVAPFRRLAFANMRPPAPFWLLASIPLVVLLRPRATWEQATWRRAGAVVALVLGLVLAGAALDSYPHRFVWQSVRGLIPFTAGIAALLIVRPGLARTWAEPPGRRFVPLALITAFASLVQFPFSSPVYFLYVAPLLLLTVVALVGSIGRTPEPLAGATLAFYGAFAVALVVPGAVTGLGFRFEPDREVVSLDLPRAGLRIRPDDALVYQRLIPALQERASQRPVWAGPDAPEIYFLGGFRNHSRALFDFLGEEPGLLSALPDRLEREGVGAIAINQEPSFSPPVPEATQAELRRRFPESERFGRYEVRWRP